MNRIDQALSESPPGLWPFLPAGYPDIETTVDLLRAWADLPIRGIELGFPFSDPVADGPVIQHAFAHALDGGATVRRIFECVASVRAEVGCPILAMVSASIVYRHGVEGFIGQARAAGLDGLIVPDLSLEEAAGVSEAVGRADLRMPMLVAPTTPPARQRAIAEAASGFLYYVAVQGTTGERNALPADLERHVTALRADTGIATLVGFGISSAAAVRQVCAFADGAIVGSAVVRRLIDHHESAESRSQTVQSVTRFVAELCGG